MLRKRFPFFHSPLVSVLIPARDEARNIAGCLDTLLLQTYKNMEIIVYNDQSTDATTEIAGKYAQKYSKIRLLEGSQLPPGWVGKNWACHQLSQAANGDYLIFTDADNRYAPSAVRNTLGWMKKYNLGMLSAFPQQITKTFAEKLVVPVIDLILYGALPLWLAHSSRRPSLSAANGQWIAFTRESYQHIGGHQAVHNQIVEDVELSRRAKNYSINSMTLAGTGILFGRMYRSAGEVWQGFSKNLFGLVSYKTLPFFAILALFFTVGVLPYFLLFYPVYFKPALAAVITNMYLRLMLAIKYKHDILIPVILHPVSILATIAIGMNSFLSFKQKRINWKGRSLPIEAKMKKISQNS